MHKTRAVHCSPDYPGIAEFAELFHVQTADVEKISQPSTLVLKKARRFATKKKPYASKGISPCTAAVAVQVQGGIKYREMCIERPVSSSTSLNMTKPRNWPDFTAKHQWEVRSIRTFWTSGYKLSDLQTIFDAVPSPLYASIAKMFVCIDDLRSQPPRSG